MMSVNKIIFKKNVRPVSSLISNSDPVYNFLLLFAFPQSELLTIENTKENQSLFILIKMKLWPLFFIIHATAEVKSRIL